MSQDLVNDFANGMEMKETSFMDLPNEILFKIFKYLDSPTWRKLRINKKLDGLYPSFVTYKFDTIELEIFASSTPSYELILYPSSCRFRRRKFRSRDLDGFVEGLNRLARNTTLRVISVRSYGDSIEMNGRIIDAFSNFITDELILKGDLRHITFSTLLAFAQNIRLRVRTDALCFSVTAQDLFAIRKFMLEGDSKLESLSLMILSNVIDEAMKVCFGVTIEYERFNAIYRTTDESVEFYCQKFDPINGRRSTTVLSNYDGDFETDLHRTFFKIKKHKGGARPDNKYEKIKMNHPYPDY